MALDNTPTEAQLTAHIPMGAMARRSHWLLVARTSLLTISTLTLMLYIVGTPVYFDRLSPSRAGCIDECLTPSRVQALHAAGISIATYAVYWVAVNVLFALVYFAVAALILWRKPGERMAWFASFTLMVLGASFPSIPATLAAVHPAWWLPVTLVSMLSFPSLAALLFLFPNGRFIPRWTRWITIGFAAVYIYDALFPDSLFSFTNWYRLFKLLLALVVFSLMVFAQIYRYHRVSTPVERQQTKWVVFSATIALLGFLLLGVLPPRLFPVQNLALLPLVFGETSIYLVLLLIPLSMALAILRYRLWDVDSIINRTLVYGD